MADEYTIDPDSTYGKAVIAIAQHYRTDHIDRIMQALDTAIDDSYDWSKYSDDGGKLRRKESENLSSLWVMFRDAKAFKNKRKKKEIKP